STADLAAEDGCAGHRCRRRSGSGITDPGGPEIAVFGRRVFFHVDWVLLVAILVLMGIGVTMIYSTTYVHLPEPGHPGPQFRTQIYAIVLGLFALLVCLAVDYRKLAESALVLYGGLILLLVYVLFQGSTQY